MEERYFILKKIIKVFKIFFLNKISSQKIPCSFARFTSSFLIFFFIYWKLIYLVYFIISLFILTYIPIVFQFIIPIIQEKEGFYGNFILVIIFFNKINN